LNIKHINLDQIQWQPGWVETPTNEFRSVLKRNMEEAGDSWVIDGNYESKVGKMVGESATDIICKFLWKAYWVIHLSWVSP
jgi:hypothetical protein